MLLRKKAQLSLELLLLLSVLFAFLLALAPAINQARLTAELASVSKAHQIALETITSNARQAYVLGNGARLQASVNFKTPISLQKDGNALKLGFSVGEINKTLSRTLDFETSLLENELEAGVYQVFFENNGIRIAVSFSRVETKTNG